jgi:hypothetical protein
MTTTHHDTMTRFLRTLWRRLLPPGGDVATAREPDDRESFIPGRRPLRVHWLGYRPEPQPMGDWLADSAPRLEDLSPDGRCWFWYGHGWLLDQPVLGRPADILWLPYSAIADPTTEP